jgi:acetylserotonin O-methyltransferase
MTSPPNETSTDRNAEIVLSLLDGFRAAKAMFVAVSLGIFDQLHRQTATAAELAETLGCETHALERILGSCVALQLLTVDNGRYRNSEAARRFLRVESSETLSGYILYSDRVLWRLWAHLEDAVRQGTHRWQQEFGSREGIFEHFFASDQDKETFLAGMHGMGLLSSPSAVAAFDLSGFTRMVDVGGATGHVVIEACRRYPDLQGIIFDLPAVIPVSTVYVGKAGMEQRIQTVAGDFFTDPLPGADLYALGRILHDWSEEKVRFLLRKICGHLPTGGGLLICEKLLNEDRSGPSSAYLQSLNMLVCTEGRERTPAEYEALTKEAGFREFVYRRTGQPVDVMLARK